MPNPLKELVPALKVLSENLDILPATGQAIEDPQHPDQDEIEDKILAQGENIFDIILETPNRELYRPTPPLFRKEKQLFYYFQDGSRRSYFIGTAIEGDRSTPIQISQIGAAVIRRESDGSIRTVISKNKVLLLIAKNQISDEVWNQLKLVESVSGVSNFEIVDISEEDVLTGSTSSTKDIRIRASDKAHSMMRRLEVDVTSEVQRKEGEWLVIDGFLRFEFEKMIRQPQIIAVAKSFSKEPIFHLGRGPGRKKLNIMSLLAGLPAEHRTCVFSAQSGAVAFWYVRLRQQGQVDYPLMGVVKVELPNPSGEAVDTELVDLISRALVAEKNVTPYGKDRRWHAHLYPIYIAEQVVKNSFLSTDIIRHSIKWGG